MTTVAKTATKPLPSHFPERSIIGPAAILFISANVANAANLLFNMIFARLMGPAIFADLTLLLTLKLGALSFLGAVQFAFSERAAKERDLQTNKLRAHALSWQSLKISIPIMFVIIASANIVSSWLNFSSPWALSILALAIPFFMPMVIYRGLTQGLINIPKIVLSIQAEWIIRLMGSVILWKLGLGLPGIAIAVGLSIVAGFLFSTDKQDWRLRQNSPRLKSSAQAKALGVVALPYLILQIAQVLVLDSDILIAKASFTAETAGLVAGLLLIQRVFFFAFLSCSTILQPYVARQSAYNGNNKESAHKAPKELLALLLAIAGITAAALVLIIPYSDWIVKLMLGDAYLALSPIVWISALTGAAFIISHLCAVYQIAKGKRLAAQIVLAFSLIQIVSLTAANHFLADLALSSYFMIKLGIQSICAICLFGVVMKPTKTSPTS